jgi:hypothetical protein
MTPLKAASRAYVNAGSGNEKTGRTAYDQWRERDQLEADGAMRAALMALAEADLPLAVQGRELSIMDHAVFRAMLRTIFSDQ